jgi:hypothetical protein
MSPPNTADKANPFRSVPSPEFREMLAVDRYGERSNVFDRLILETHLHFWDPLDSAYLPLDAPFDTRHQMIVPPEMVPELRSSVADRLSGPERIRFVNETARWWLSSLLHGEQGALSLASSLCHLLRDPAAVEYAANQAREEARHVTAFARYIERRWSTPFPASPSLSALLGELVSAREIYKKIVGMQILVEGLAMGVFSVLHRRCTDPALKRLTQLVMIDEAFHHVAGKMWAESVLPTLAPQERDAVEDWAASCFRAVVSNLFHPEQKKGLYESFGLDWRWVRDAMREIYVSKERRAELEADTEIFHTLVRTLLRAGIITNRTRHFYTIWLDLDSLAESEDLIDSPIVADGIDYLNEINRGRNVRRKGRGAWLPTATADSDP